MVEKNGKWLMAYGRCAVSSGKERQMAYGVWLMAEVQ